MRHIPHSWEGRAGRGHELPGREAGPVQGAGGVKGAAGIQI